MLYNNTLQQCQAHGSWLGQSTALCKGCVTALIDAIAEEPYFITSNRGMFIFYD